MRTSNRVMMPVAVVLLIAGICVSFFLLYSKRYDDGLHIEDQSGDRSALNAITIRGVLADSVQRTAFEYQNASFKKDYQVRENRDIVNYDYDRAPEHQPVTAKESFDLTDDAKTYEMDTKINGKSGRLLRANKAVVVFDANGYHIKSNIIIQSYAYNIERIRQETSEGTVHDTYHIGNDDVFDTSKLNPIETVGDKLYLYTPTSDACSGYGGVYDISAEGDGDGPQNIAPVDLKDGAVRIVGMKASADWLVFICVDGQSVILKPFNLAMQAFSDDVYIAKTPEAAADESSNGNGANTDINVTYNAAMQDSGIFNLEIRAEGTTGVRSGFYTVDLRSHQKVLSYNEINPISASSSIIPRETVFKYDSGTLYVLRMFTQDTYIVQGKTDYLPESCVHISVINDGDSLYEGDIVSDAKDDFRCQGTDMYSGYGKDDVRGYYYMKID